MSPYSGRITAKRVLDTILILSFSPLLVVLLAGSALAVKVSMSSPVLFTQRRIGLNGRQFSVLKFRTMSNERDSIGEFLPDQQRLTKTGRILRKLSLDELPQLINVLRGDMALVGPRPLLVEYLPYYSDRERVRHSVRPGITGAAQVVGRNGLLWDRRLEIDADYAESATLLGDLWILLSTVKSVLFADGVSVVAGDSGERLDVMRSYPNDGTYALRRLEFVDAQTCVEWFRERRARGHLKIPADITLEALRLWITESRRVPARRDFVMYEVSSGNLCAMLDIDGEHDPTLVQVNVMVDPSRRGQGVESTSMRLLSSWLKRRSSVSGCWLTAHPDQVADIRLYQSLGFSCAGEHSDGQMRLELTWAAHE